MFQLKKLTPDGIQRALGKVERYRLLNEPAEAESICRDVLDADPGNEEATISLLLSLTDQFDQDVHGTVAEAQSLVERLSGEYERAYYSGIICERRGAALLKRGLPGSGTSAYEWYRRGMDHYEQAEALRPPGNDDALVRWNTCVRTIGRHDLQPALATRDRTLLE